VHRHEMIGDVSIWSALHVRIHDYPLELPLTHESMLIPTPISSSPVKSEKVHKVHNRSPEQEHLNQTILDLHEEHPLHTPSKDFHSR